MGDGKYTDLTVVAADGSKEVFFAVYKATKVENFKRMIGIQSLGRIRSWEDINLFCFNVELKDDEDQTLESYNLQNGSIIRYILSPGAAKRSEKKRPILTIADVTETAPPPPYPTTEGSPLLDKELKSVFVRDIDDGRTQNLGRRENPDSRPFLLGTSIKELRAEVARRQGWDISHVRMLYGAKELEDIDRRTKETNTLFTYGFQDEGTIHIVSRLPGGMPKKH